MKLAFKHFRPVSGIQLLSFCRKLLTNICSPPPLYNINNNKNIIIAPNANKMRIHTDQLMMSKSLMYMCCLLWRAGHNKLIANPCLPGK